VSCAICGSAGLGDCWGLPRSFSVTDRRDHARRVFRETARSTKIVLGAADGVANKVLARQLSTSVRWCCSGGGDFQELRLIGIVEDVPRLESFKFSADPEFVAKVRDIVGLYLNPPGKAIVSSVDEKSHVQALDHTQAILPLPSGLPKR
jgi:hypothetical protein